MMLAQKHSRNDKILLWLVDFEACRRVMLLLEKHSNEQVSVVEQ